MSSTDGAPVTDPAMARHAALGTSPDKSQAPWSPPVDTTIIPRAQTPTSAHDAMHPPAIPAPAEPSLLPSPRSPSPHQHPDRRSVDSGVSRTSQDYRHHPQVVYPAGPSPGPYPPQPGLSYQGQPYPQPAPPQELQPQQYVMFPPTPQGFYPPPNAARPPPSPLYAPPQPGHPGQPPVQAHMPGPHHSWSGPPQPQPYQPYPAPQQQQGIPQGHPQGEYSDGFMNALGSNMDDLTLSEDSMPDLPPLDDSAPRPTFTTLGRKKTARLPPAPVEGEAAPVTKTTAQAQAQAQLQLNQQPGTSISLLKNIDIYRKSAKSTNDPELQFEFAKFCVESSEQLEEPKARAKLLDEGFTWLKKLSQSGFTEATYYLGLAYTHDGRHDQALSQYLAAAKKFHPSACYATADAMENARGTRKDTKNALQFYKKGATAGHKPSMFRLGVAYLHGELGLKQDVKEAVRWLKRGAAVADREHPEALYQLFLIYERGLPPQIPADVPYARSVLMEAANLGYVPALSKLGACYKDGILEFPVDPRESVRFFSEAAQGGDKEAQFALSGWYLVGVDGVLQQNEEEAFYWAQKAAKKNLARAQYAVGHFLEMGIGTPKNMEEAMKMYMSAAKIGDSQARQRLEKAGVDIDKELKKNQKDCIIS